MLFTVLNLKKQFLIIFFYSMQLQMEEEEMNRKRAANRTALEAIGGPRKKRKLDEALESLQTPNSGPNTTLTPSSSSSNITSQVNIIFCFCL